MFAPSSSHLVFHWQHKVLKRQSTVTQKVKIMVNLFQEREQGKGLEQNAGEIKLVI